MPWQAPPSISRPTVDKATAKVIRLDSAAPLTKLDNKYDYIIVFPKFCRTSGTRISGGGNVLLVGGYCSTGQGRTEPNIIVADGRPNRTVWIEGLLIDGRQGGRSDAFHLQCPNTRVQLYKNRVETLNGALSSTHADVIQNMGCKSLQVQRFTGASYYNNMYFRRENDPVGNPIGPTTFRNTNVFGYSRNPIAKGSDPTHTLRGISLGTQPIPPSDPTDPINGKLSGSVWLYNYYVDYESFGIPRDQAVWPHAAPRMEASCRAQISSDGRSIDWPRWRDSSYPPQEESVPSTPGQIGSGDATVYGVVTFGPPPSGDYVVAKSVGLNYPRIA